MNVKKKNRNAPILALSVTGFTFIEAIIVFLIIGILAAVIVTDINNSVFLVRLEGARWKLKGDLSYAQSLAVTQQANHGILFNPASETYSVYRQNTSNIVNNPLTGAPFTVNYSTNSELKGVDLASTIFGVPTTNRVEFDNLGIPSDGTIVLTSDGSVTLNYNGSTAVVTVTKNTGKVN